MKKSHVANAFTLANLLCGCFSIYFAGVGQLQLSAYFVFIAAGFDFVDGFVARLLKVQSELGKQLDSLADVVSFGVTPSFIIFYLLKNSFHHCNYYVEKLLPFSAFIIAAAAALRLAKFNVDERQTDSFIGLPTPANALFLASFVLIPETTHVLLNNLLLSPVFLLFIVLIMSNLMTGEIPLFSLKFKSFKWSENKMRFTFVLFSLLLTLWLWFTAVPVIVVIYVLLSVVENRFFNK